MNLKAGFFWWNRLDLTFDARSALSQNIGYPKIWCSRNNSQKEGKFY
jgi:hypothetical protein